MEDGKKSSPEKGKEIQLQDQEKRTGILYLSRIPNSMTVKKVREIFSHYGEVGRMFLQVDEKASVGKRTRVFSEGWIEFLDKRIAKRVALSLNNTQVGGKKRSPYYFDIWNIKYLHSFKWSHLDEQLEYEKTVRQHRIRAEVMQAKKETDFYKRNVEKNKTIKKIEKKNKVPLDQQEWTFRQRDTEDEILGQKKRKVLDSNDDDKQSESSKTSKSVGKKTGSSEEVSGEPKLKRSKNTGIPSKASENKSFLKTLFSGGLADSDDDDNS